MTNKQKSLFPEFIPDKILEPQEPSGLFYRLFQEFERGEHNPPSLFWADGKTKDGKYWHYSIYYLPKRNITFERYLRDLEDGMHITPFPCGYFEPWNVVSTNDETIFKTPSNSGFDIIEYARVNELEIEYLV